MKIHPLIFVPVIICFIACTKDEKVNSGTYTGVSISLNPLAPPNDSVGTTVTLNISGNQFSGTSDTSVSSITPVIGGGTYAIKSKHITFIQNSAVNVSGTDHSVLEGEYDLLKNGDSLVFSRFPEPRSIGAGPIYFRLRAN